MGQEMFYASDNEAPFGAACSEPDAELSEGGSDRLGAYSWPRRFAL